MKDKTLGRVLFEDAVFGLSYLFGRVLVTLIYFGYQRLKETYR